MLATSFEVTQHIVCDITMNGINPVCKISKFSQEVEREWKKPERKGGVMGNIGVSGRS